MVERTSSSCVNWVFQFVSAAIDYCTRFVRDSFRDLGHRRYSKLVFKFINNRSDEQMNFEK